MYIDDDNYVMNRNYSFHELNLKDEELFILPDKIEKNKLWTRKNKAKVFGYTSFISLTTSFILFLIATSSGRIDILTIALFTITLGFITGGIYRAMDRHNGEYSIKEAYYKTERSIDDYFEEYYEALNQYYIVVDKHVDRHSLDNMTRRHYELMGQSYEEEEPQRSIAAKRLYNLLDVNEDGVVFISQLVKIPDDEDEYLILLNNDPVLTKESFNDYLSSLDSVRKRNIDKSNLEVFLQSSRRSDENVKKALEAKDKLNNDEVFDKVNNLTIGGYDIRGK